MKSRLPQPPDGREWPNYSNRFGVFYKIDAKLLVAVVGDKGAQKEVQVEIDQQKDLENKEQSPQVAVVVRDGQAKLDVPAIERGYLR